MGKFMKRESIVSQALSLIQETRVSDHSSKQNCIGLKTLPTSLGLQKNNNKNVILMIKMKLEEHIMKRFQNMKTRHPQM
jgi:hypothetical protein